MAGMGLEFDAEHLHAGANQCHDAAGMALASSDKLAGKVPAAGIFGDFAEARAFHSSLSAAHHDHVEQLRGHHRSLTDIGDKSHSAASQLLAQDASAADSLRAAEAGFSTS